MNEKADIYPYHRMTGRRTKSKPHLPSFPKSDLQSALRRAVSWETGLLVILAFLAGRGVLAGGLMPFPAALLAAVLVVMPDRGLWVLLAALGGLLTQSTGYKLWGSAAVLVFLMLLLNQNRDRFREKWYGVPLLLIGIITAVKVCLFAFYAPELYNYILAVTEAILAGCASYLLVKALPAMRKTSNLPALSKDEIIGGAVLIITVLTGLSGIKAGSVEIRNIAARLLVMLAAYTGGGGLGAAMGTLVGMVPSMTLAMAPGLVAIYSFSGLLAGLFRGLGRIGICIGFILGNVLLSIYLNEYSSLVATFIETAAAVLLFMLISPKHLFALRSTVKSSLFGNGLRSADETKVRENTAGKIREYGRIFHELSRTFGEISCDVRTYEENNLQSLFNGVAAKVCKGCSLYRICWEREFYKTYRNIMDMLTNIEINGRISEMHISPDIQKRCTRLKELAITVNCLFETYKQAQMWQRKITEGRDILAGQLGGIASIMQNLADEVKIDTRMRGDIEVILRSELTKAGYNILGLRVMGEGEQMEIGVSCPSCGGNMSCVEGIGPLVSRILSQPLTVLNSNYCTKKTGESICEFKLMPTKKFSVEMGYTSAAKDCGLVSGDSYSTFDLKDGRFAVILSDGMGVGQKAAMESRATITLLEKLLETGFSSPLAVKTVNSLLVLGSPEETFATVDLAVVNLMNGVIEFIKIGAAPSFVKRGSQVGMIRASSLPIGILNDIEVDTIQQPMGHDDVLVVISDGLLLACGDEKEGEAWVLDALQETITTDPQNIAEMLLHKAMQNAHGAVHDDMTVVVARLVSSRS